MPGVQLTGLLVQRWSQVAETIVGMSRDPAFGRC